MALSRRRIDPIVERLSEFTLKRLRFIDHSSELTAPERQSIKEWAEWAVGDSEDIENFFEHRSKAPDPYRNTDKIRIMEFDWTHDGITETLLDINNWSGNSDFRWENGAIAINGKIVFRNDDSRLIEIESTPEQLRGRLEAYEHLRKQDCVDRQYDEGYSYEHKHCHTTYLKSLELS